MSTARFAHVGLACKDPLATERFYTRNFGFHRARVVPLGDEQIVFLKNPSQDLCLEVFRASEASPVPPALADGPSWPSFKHLAFQVDDVNAMLRAMGEDARVTQGPMDFDDFIPGWRAVWIADPDDRIIEICQGYVDQDSPPALET